MLKNVKFVKFERRDKYFCNVKRSKIVRKCLITVVDDNDFQKKKNKK